MDNKVKQNFNIMLWSVGLDKFFDCELMHEATLDEAKQRAENMANIAFTFDDFCFWDKGLELNVVRQSDRTIVATSTAHKKDSPVLNAEWNHYD